MLSKQGRARGHLLAPRVREVALTQLTSGHIYLQRHLFGKALARLHPDNFKRMVIALAAWLTARRSEPRQHPTQQKITCRLAATLLDQIMRGS
mmetsp:Transcript_80126/g.141902  ORF Transcript_80126/g.141902 Transcript_80126/m.141902 type:complete len:93 (+) Transcript_80126:695-973(+)